ncbi:PucR family transcriptional regulator [Alkalicoccus halolimnae]|uniref:PucR family transcriptional regulator ligand-binding domain-containing protein n=1 Tax=Alkalicoccus halolimnae TaxID=1667239 RepID=A0A5C7FGV5_9BACI|nr:PucR family transcriptional regulator [Alkalicoccus halolimnae]TXF84003.1 PucR family transcriptional regulator [Alkalicoccus halolimnae]
MGVYASQIMNTPVFASAVVRAGEKVLHSTEVEWVSIIEMPVENFVREREFVLTTGIGCKGDVNLLEQFVQDVINSGASMLGIATGRHIFDIPDRVTKLAEEHHFIIVEIPWAVRAGDIISTVLEEINRGKRDERQVTEEIRQEFINKVLHEGDIQEISEALHRHLGMPSIITEYDGRMRAFYHTGKEILEAVENKEMTEPKKYESEQFLGEEFSSHRLHPHIYVFDILGERWGRILVNTNHRKQGYLWFRPNPQQQINWFTMNVLEHAVTACALFFVKENAVEMTEIRLKDNFILKLAKQSGEEEYVLRSKAELLGYDLSLPYVCIVGEIHSRGRRSVFPAFQSDNPPTSSLQNVNYYIQKEITNAARFLNKRAMTTFDENEVIIFLEADHQLYTETANQFLDSVDRRLNEMLTGIELSWGIASKRSEPTAFHDSYREAKSALDIGMKQHGPGGRTFYKDTRINRLLLAVSENASIDQIVRDTVEPLAEYDKKRQTDLIETFTTYNKYNGNVSQTARALHLHRQSLLYRLRNIESLTKLSLIDADDVFLLELTIRLWKMKDMENS